MNYVYSVMWLLIAVMLIKMGIKESKLYLIFSIYFTFNAVWWFISAVTSADMFHGTLGWVFRGITLAFLIIGVAYYFLVERKKPRKNDDSTDE